MRQGRPLVRTGLGEAFPGGDAWVVSLMVV